MGKYKETPRNNAGSEQGYTIGMGACSAAPDQECTDLSGCIIGKVKQSLTLFNEFKHSRESISDAVIFQIV